MSTRPDAISDPAFARRHGDRTPSRRSQCVTHGAGSPRSSCSRSPRRSSTPSPPHPGSTGASSDSSCSIPQIMHGVLVTLELTVHRDGDRCRPRRDPRGDAPLRQPGRLIGQLVLHLVLPRDSGAGADLLLVQHRLDPAATSTSAYRSPTSRGSGRPTRSSRHFSPPCSASASTKRRTCPRSSVRESSRWIPARAKQPRHSA